MLGRNFKEAYEFLLPSLPCEAMLLLVSVALEEEFVRVQSSPQNWHLQNISQLI